MDKSIKKTLAYRKSEYNKNQKVKLEQAGRTGQWWSVAKYVGSDENPRGWTVIDLDPDKTAPVLANELATHFTAVTNENESLSLIDIPKVAEEGYVRHLDPREVARRLKKMKKPASRAVSYTHLTLPTIYSV